MFLNDTLGKTSSYPWRSIYKANDLVDLDWRQRFETRRLRKTWNAFCRDLGRWQKWRIFFSFPCRIGQKRGRKEALIHVVMLLPLDFPIQKEEKTPFRSLTPPISAVFFPYIYRRISFFFWQAGGLLPFLSPSDWRPRVRTNERFDREMRPWRRRDRERRNVFSVFSSLNFASFSMHHSLHCFCFFPSDIGITERALFYLGDIKDKG